MTELKTQALAKMNDELSKPHSKALDQIHNWLCEQEDEVLFTNILKAGKTIANGIQYAAGKARATAVMGSGVVISTNDEVYQWIAEYFASDAKEIKSVANVQTAPKAQSTPAHRSTEEQAEIAAKVHKTTEAIIKKHEAQKKASKPEVMMNIFDFLGEPDVKTQAEIIAEIKEEAKANAWEDEVNVGDETIESNNDNEDEETETNA